RTPSGRGGRGAAEHHDAAGAATLAAAADLAATAHRKAGSGLRAGRAEGRTAGLLGRLELGVGRIDSARVVDLHRHHALAVEVRVGHVHAVLPHAAGKGQRLVLHLLLLLGGEVDRAGVAHQVLAGLVGLLELARVGVGLRVASRRTGAEGDDTGAAAAGVGVGHVDAVLPHTAGEG